MKTETHWELIERKQAGRAVVYTLLTLLVVTVSVVVFCLTGCTAGELRSPCDAMTLERESLACRSAVRSACARSDAGVVDETCPTLIECQRRIESWRACVDGGEL